MKTARMNKNEGRITRQPKILLHQQEEVRKLKREPESQSVRLCEVMEKNKKALNDKEMVDDDRRLLTTRIEGKGN